MFSFHLFEGSNSGAELFSATFASESWAEELQICMQIDLDVQKESTSGVMGRG